MFRVTQPYLNLLVKSRTFSEIQIIRKNIILCKMPFKMYKIIFSPQKQKQNKKICVPTLPKIFRPVTRNTLNFFIYRMALFVPLYFLYAGLICMIVCPVLISFKVLSAISSEFQMVWIQIRPNKTRQKKRFAKVTNRQH